MVGLLIYPFTPSPTMLARHQMFVLSLGHYEHVKFLRLVVLHTRKQQLSQNHGWLVLVRSLKRQWFVCEKRRIVTDNLGSERR